MQAAYLRLLALIERAGPWSFYSLIAAVALALYAVPAVLSNESSYLILSRALLDPTFLAADWETSVRLAGRGTSAIFDYAIAPLWGLSNDPAIVALSARMILVAATIAALLYLVRRLELPLLPAAAGIILWLLWGQSMAANEWIFGGAEKKVVAYILGFVAYGLLLRNRPLVAGVCGGAAAAAHLLVGGWICIALAGALLFTERRIWPQLLIFCAAVLLVAAPFLISSALFALGGSTVDAQFAGRSSAELITLWRNPHHANALEFLHEKNLVAILGFFLLSFTCAWISLAARARVFTLSSLACLTLLWLSALIASYAEVSFVLYLFPARVGDVMIPFIFLLCAPQAVLLSIKEIMLQGWSFVPTITLVAITCLSLFVVKHAQYHAIPTVQYNLQTWQHYLSDQSPPFAGAANWLQENTERQDVVIAPVRTEWLKLHAQRPMVISMKGSPGNTAIHEWFCRLYVLNGQRAFSQLGYGMLAEVDAYIEGAPRNTLLENAAQLNARYYLSSVDREDMAELAAYSDKHYTIYDLHRASASAVLESDAGVDYGIEPQHSACLTQLAQPYAAIQGDANVH